jgi:hypothetical protein
MKSRILDLSDCSESPLLGESKCRRKWAKISWTDRSSVRQGRLHSRSHPKISGLTEEYFTGVNKDAALQFDFQDKVNAPEPQAADPANISYQARCAQRWWAEFCHWLGQRPEAE